jgi:hypothetical protein
LLLGLNTMKMVDDIGIPHVGQKKISVVQTQSALVTHLAFSSDF